MVRWYASGQTNTLCQLRPRRSWEEHGQLLFQKAGTPASQVGRRYRKVPRVPAILYLYSVDRQQPPDLSASSISTPAVPEFLRVSQGAIIGNLDRESREPCAPVIRDNFSIFFFNELRYTDVIYPRWSTHVSLALACMLSLCVIKWWELQDSLADFSQRWHGIRQGKRTRAVQYVYALGNGKSEFFRVENSFTCALWMKNICSLAARASCTRKPLCLFCKKKVMYERSLLHYRVNFRVSWTRLNHRQNLCLIVSYCFCSFGEFVNVFERNVWHVRVAHFHSAARGLSSTSRCFKLSRNLETWLWLFVDVCAEMLQQF